MEAMSSRARSVEARHPPQRLVPPLPPAVQLDKEQIRAEATAVRRRVEIIAPALICPPNLRGMCGYGASGVFLALRERGVRTARVVQGSFGGLPHFWAEVDGLLVDVTATQFGEYPPVVLLPTGQAAWWPKRRFKPRLVNVSAYGCLLLSSGWWRGDAEAEALHATLLTDWWKYREVHRW